MDIKVVEISIAPSPFGSMAKIGDRVAAAVRAARLKKGMTQEQVAEAVGTTLRTISRIEGGDAVASLETFFALIVALDLDPARVLGVKRQARDLSRERLLLEERTIQIVESLSDTRLGDLAAIAELLAKRT